MNRAGFLARIGGAVVAGLVGRSFGREAAATTELQEGASDTAAAVPAEPSPTFASSDGVSGTIVTTHNDGTICYTLNFDDVRVL